jgi:DNA-binding protein H-NS
MATYSELLAQKEALRAQQAALEKQIAEQLNEQRAGAIAQIKGIMGEFGLTVADLGNNKPGRPPKSVDSGAAPSSKVAAKYRDPDSGKTWSGRGLKPRWLADAIAAGRQLTDFAIQS